MVLDLVFGIQERENSKNWICSKNALVFKEYNMYNETSDPVKYVAAIGKLMDWRRIPQTSWQYKI